MFCLPIPTLKCILYICEGFIYFQNQSVYFAADWSWECINSSQTHECRNWDRGHAIPFPGIHKLDFWYSVRTHKLWHFWKKRRSISKLMNILWKRKFHSKIFRYSYYRHWKIISWPASLNLGESLCCDWDRCNQSLEVYHANHTLRKSEVHYFLYNPQGLEVT